MSELVHQLLERNARKDPFEVGVRWLPTVPPLLTGSGISAGRGPDLQDKRGHQGCLTPSRPGSFLFSRLRHRYQVAIVS